MAQTRQRRREVARAKWERQQARRAHAAARARRWRIVGGVVAAVVAVGLLTWLGINIVQAENGTQQAPVNPPVPTAPNTPQTNQPTSAPSNHSPTPTHPTEGTR